MTRRIAALAAVVACAGVCAGPAAASTANSSKATQLCSKVSASTVSSIIGRTVPAATGTVLNEKASKENDDIAFSVLNCAYGSDTTIAAIKKTVDVSLETLSRSLTAADFKKLVDQEHALSGVGVKVVPYPSLGSEAFLVTVSEAGLKLESLAVESGTKVWGATAEGGLSTSKLASLVKLAAKL